MAQKKNLKKSYELLRDWYEYRAKENAQSLTKLQKLLAELDHESVKNADYDKDVDDLESLRFIYETGIRNFESQADKYRILILEM